MNFHEKESVALYFDNLTIIEDIHSDFHHILLCEHPRLGKILIIDDEIMHVEKYEFFYHEPLIHLPFAISPRIESVLILGGGSLFAAREVLKYSRVKNVILCDHDKQVLNVIKGHYKHAGLVLSDKRFKYIENDALKYLANANAKFDLIVNDCFDLSKTFLNTVNMYDALDNYLTAKGLCSDMVYNDIFDQDSMDKALFYIKKKPSIFYSMMCIPEYPGILHLHTIWAKNKVNFSFDNKNSEQLNLFVKNQYRLYNPNYLKYYFYLPKFLKDIIK